MKLFSKKNTIDPLPYWGLSEVLTIAIPSTINMTSFTLMQFVDGWMVSLLGKKTLVAHMTAGISSFAAICFFMGTLTCVNTFASQNLGAGKPKRAALYGWQGVWIGIFAGLFLLTLIPIAPYIFKLFGHEPGIEKLEISYFRIMMAGSGIVMVSKAISNFFIGIHKPVITLIGGVVGNIINVGANYLLIFGNFGFPKLGLTGAAIGTVIGGFFELFILAAIFLTGPLSQRFSVTKACSFNWIAMKQLLKIGTPSGANFLSDIMMWTVFMSVIIGRFGTDHLAATAILNRYWHLGFMPSIGIGIACTAIVGKYCGSRQFDLAWRRAHVGLLLSEAYMITAGVLAWIFREELVAFFNSTGDPNVQKIATSLFILIIIVQAFDSLCITFIGALRGAGDTFWPAVTQVGLAWGVGIGGALLISKHAPSLGSWGAWIAATLYIVSFGTMLWVRFLKRKWEKLHLVKSPRGLDHPKRSKV